MYSHGSLVKCMGSLNIKYADPGSLYSKIMEIILKGVVPTAYFKLHYTLEKTWIR